MTRDLDLIRLILVRAEASEDFTVMSDSFEGQDERKVAQHFHLLDEAGFIQANLMFAEGYGAAKGSIERLTWDGHEFLSTMKNDVVWKKTQTIVADKGGSISLEVLKSLATQVALKLFSLE